MQSLNVSGVPVVITAQSVNLTQKKRLPYLRMKPRLAKLLVGLGAVQIPFGILAIVFNAVAIGMLPASGNFFQDVRLGGISAGVLFIVTGPFGIVGGIKKGRCHVIVFNVLSIISTVLAGFMIDEGIVSAMGGSTDYIHNYYHDDRPTLGVVFWSHLFVIGFLELIVAICSSVVCCSIGACCCDCDGLCCCPTDYDAAQIAEEAQSADRESLPLMNLKHGDLDSVSTQGTSDLEVLVDSNPWIKIGPNQVKSFH